MVEAGVAVPCMARGFRSLFEGSADVAQHPFTMTQQTQPRFDISQVDALLRGKESPRPLGEFASHSRKNDHGLKRMPIWPTRRAGRACCMACQRSCSLLPQFINRVLRFGLIHEAARALDVAPSTAFRWRHRFLAQAQGVKAQSLRASPKPMRPSSLGRSDKAQLLAVLQPMLAPDVVLCTDGSSALAAAARHIGVEAPGAQHDLRPARARALARPERQCVSRPAQRMDASLPRRGHLVPRQLPRLVPGT